MAERNSSSSSTSTGLEPGGMGSTFASGTASTTTRQSSAAGIGESQSKQGGIAERVRERAKEQISSQKDRATEGLGTVAQAVRQTTQGLRDQHHETVASYIEQAANQIEKLSRDLKDKDVGELVEDAQRLARRQPALFVGSAFALGLLGARFFKSSPPDDRQRFGEYDQGERGRYGARGYERTSSSAYGGGAFGADPGHTLPSSSIASGASGPAGSVTTGSTPGRSRSSSSSSPSRNSPDTERS